MVNKAFHLPFLRQSARDTCEGLIPIVTAQMIANVIEPVLPKLGQEAASDSRSDGLPLSH